MTPSPCRPRPLFALLLGLLTLYWAPFAQAFFGEDELLPVEEAFAFSAEVTPDGRLHARWEVADGYYLYRSRIQLHSNTPGIEIGEPVFPPGEPKQDEFFGEMEVYHGKVEIVAPLLVKDPALDSLELRVSSQGCAERGVCYPPHTRIIKLKLPPAAAPPAPAASKPGPFQALKDLGQSLGLGAEEGIPPVEVAFRVSAGVLDANTLRVRWDIDDCCYLYRKRLSFELLDGEGVRLLEARLPAGDPKDDPIFGRVEVYHKTVEAILPLARSNTAATRLRLKVGYQGCASRGVCYPPQTKTFELSLPAADGGTAAKPAAPAAAAEGAPPISAQDRIAARLASGSTLAIVLSFFGFGLLLAFTPCVFPMIPILSSIIIGQGEKITTRRAFVLSLVYVLAMALTYTAAGVFAGLSGESLQAAFQNPWILSAFAGVFVLLALSMFGFYDLQMPAFIQTRLTAISNRQRGGSLLGVAVMGFLSALIVGPCVAAPLAGALIYIGQTGDPYLGGLALFALSLGMGAPLLAIGTGAGKLLPQAGDWMNAIKAVFGVLLLAVAIWMLERILPAQLSMLLWAVLLICSAVYLGALERLGVDASGWARLRKGLGFVLLSYGVLQLVGVAADSDDIYQPLRGLAPAGTSVASGPGASHIQFQRVKTVEDLQRAVSAAAAEGRPVMLDFFAEWCTDCHRLEKYTFADPRVREALGNAVLLKADVTANDAEDKALLKHFRIPGPPSIIFFDGEGRERSRYRVMGYMPPEAFADHVRTAFGR
ncbi:protein-disulfide reductase DsbD [Thiohalobacter sp. IOR34]|uniref:protein-disulfide reductase DsbD n=1 Tax=Thiohalobacter sp. IOR34 TaxID=3057176 RepID=UPI0025B1F9BC|nr:protein-disulfide reductase DsbD [Thiohalobacter sp. IOR34]WJW75286.1 protein-disulfide reductase DsbD [Thiohalobacter sp. IOR34]